MKKPKRKKSLSARTGFPERLYIRREGPDGKLYVYGSPSEALKGRLGEAEVATYKLTRAAMVKSEIKIGRI